VYIIKNIDTIKEIVMATVSNPNFFNKDNGSDPKIQSIIDLIKELDKTVNT
jgi:hypothetical protein